MKLLYVPPLGGGIKDLATAGQHKRLLEDYCNSYLREFDEVLILSFFNERLTDYADVRLSAKVRLLPNTRGLHRYLYALLAPWLHRSALKNVSIIRVSQTTGALPAALLKLALGVQVVVTYGYDYVLFAGVRGKAAVWLARLHERLGRATADFWITTTNELVALLQDRHRAERENIFLIPNGVNLKTFASATRHNDEDLRSLIFVGRLEAQKNLVFLLNCVSATADRLQTRLKLTLVGEGSLRAQLANHKVSPLLKVELTGALEQSKLQPLFEESQLFVTASLFEGHPKAVLEAMAAGLPILGLDAPGMTPLLKASDQSVYKDVDSFVDNFRKLTDSSTRATASARARECVRRDFDLEKNLVIETELLARLGRNAGREPRAHERT